jgi:hypothetical protein
MSHLRFAPWSPLSPPQRSDSGSAPVRRPSWRRRGEGPSCRRGTRVDRPATRKRSRTSRRLPTASTSATPAMIPPGASRPGAVRQLHPLPLPEASTAPSGASGAPPSDASRSPDDPASDTSGGSGAAASDASIARGDPTSDASGGWGAPVSDASDARGDPDASVGRGPASEASGDCGDAASDASVPASVSRPNS